MVSIFIYLLPVTCQIAQNNNYILFIFRIKITVCSSIQNRTGKSELIRYSIISPTIVIDNWLVLLKIRSYFYLFVWAWL